MLTFTQNPLHWEHAQAEVDDSALKKQSVILDRRL